MAQSLISAFPSCSPIKISTRRLRPSVSASFFSSSFKCGSSHALAQYKSSKRSRVKSGAKVSSIRCEQGTKDTDGPDVWLSRGAMLAFTAALTFELTTGKGILENLGFTAPLPTVALALTALVGAGAAFFIFQSASRDDLVP